MTFEERAYKFLLDACSEDWNDRMKGDIEKLIIGVNRDAMKEAARICRETEGARLDVNIMWNEACEFCATEIEQGG